MVKAVIGVLTVFGCLVAVHAEFRVWSSKDGASNVEAQFIQTSGSKVVLEKKDGARIMVQMNKLCTKDQEYLAGVIPPKIKIDVDIDMDRDKQGNGYYYESEKQTVQCDVVISKVSREPCTREFKALLFLVSQEKGGDQMQIMSKEEKSISFAKKDSVTMGASGTATSEQGYSYSEGYEYEGYVVFILDEKDNVIASQSNRNVYESKSNVFKKLGRGDKLSESFRKI